MKIYRRPRWLKRFLRMERALRGVRTAPRVPEPEPEPAPPPTRKSPPPLDDTVRDVMAKLATQYQPGDIVGKPEVQQVSGRSESSSYLIMARAKALGLWPYAKSPVRRKPCSSTA